MPPSFSGRINTVNGVVSAVCKQVQSQRIIGIKLIIRIDKSTPFGVVVTGLEVIEACLLVTALAAEGKSTAWACPALEDDPVLIRGGFRLAKSRLRWLRSETRLRAQPKGKALGKIANPEGGYPPSGREAILEATRFVFLLYFSCIVLHKSFLA